MTIEDGQKPTDATVMDAPSKRGPGGKQPGAGRKPTHGAGKQSLSLTDFYSTRALREHLAAYMRVWNRNPTPFAWTKPAHAIIRSHRRMLERISTALH